MLREEGLRLWAGPAGEAGPRELEEGGAQPRRHLTFQGLVPGQFKTWTPACVSGRSSLPPSIPVSWGKKTPWWTYCLGLAHWEHR